MRLAVKCDRDYTIQLGLGYNLHKRVINGDLSKLNIVYNDIFVESTADSILIVDLLSYFCILRHAQPTGFLVNFEDSLSAQRIINGTFYSAEYWSYPDIYNEYFLVPTYDGIQAVSTSSKVLESFQFLTPILVPSGSGWLLNPLKIGSFVRYLHYGSLVPEDSFSVRDVLFFSYNFVIPKAGTGENAYDTTEQYCYLKSIMFADGSVSADNTAAAKASVPLFLREVPGVDWFRYVYGDIGYICSVINNDTTAIKRLYSLDGIDLQEDVTVDFTKQSINNTIDVRYYRIVDSILGECEESTKEDSEFKITKEVYYKFFQNDTSDFIYRVNFQLDTFVPRRYYIGFQAFENQYALPLKTSKITVDKLAKGDLSIVESYNLSSYNEGVKEQRINKRFTNDVIKLQGNSSLFGVGSTLYINSYSTSLFNSGSNFDVFATPGSGSGVAAYGRTCYLRGAHIGFCAVLPIHIGILVVDGQEVPVVVGSYITCDELYEDLTILNRSIVISEEGFVGVLQKTHENALALGLDVALIPTINSTGNVDYPTNRIYNTDVSLYRAGALLDNEGMAKTLPPSNIRAGVVYNIESLPKPKTAVSNESVVLFSGYDVQSHKPSYIYNWTPYYSAVYYDSAEGRIVNKVYPNAEVIGLSSLSLHKQDFIPKDITYNIGITAFTKSSALVEGAIYTAKMWLVTKYTEEITEEGIVYYIFDELIYNGMCPLFYKSGFFRFIDDGSEMLDLPIANLEYIDSSYFVFFDTILASDIVTVYQ